MEQFERFPRRRVAKPNAADDQLAQLLHALTNLNDRVGDLQRGIRTLAGAQQLGAGYTPLRPQSSAGQVVSASAGRLAGWSINNPSGTVDLTIRLHDGTDTEGQVLATIVVPALTGSTEWLLPGGVGFTQGLFLEHVNTPDAANPPTGGIFTAPAAPLS